MGIYGKLALYEQLEIKPDGERKHLFQRLRRGAEMYRRMAGAGSDRSGYQTGYDATFDPPLQKKHECPVCLFALRDPIQTACGHRFCTCCVKRILQKVKPRCPLDNELLNQDEIFPDNFCKREVLSLTVLCINKHLGCPWRSYLKELKSHVASCNFLVVACTHEGCSIFLQRRDLESHLQNDCMFRLVFCQVCNHQFVFSQQKEHDSVCPEVEIACENGCEQIVKRKEYEEHLTTSCPNVKLVCRFVSVGCKFKASKSEVCEHQVDPDNHHTDLLLQRLESFTCETVNNAGASSKKSEPPEDKLAARGSIAGELTAMGAQVERLSSSVTEKDEIISDLQQTVGGLRSTVQELTEAMQQVKNEMNLFRQEITSIVSGMSAFEQKHLASQGKVAAMEHRQLTIEKSLAVKDNALAEHDVRLLSLEMTSYDGVLRWKIAEFNRRRSEAVAGKRLSIYSPPFFTSRSGYKMCARIYLNGDGMGKASHLSLFFVMMKGEYDALLPWPFQQRVTFSLIDQDHRLHVSDTFQPDPASSSFQRPTSDMNVASGCPLFVPLEALETRGYVKDDTAFIRVAIDTKGLVHP